MKKCPKCGENIGKYPAISRRDNETEICSNCGAKEAIEDAERIFNIHGKGKVYGNKNI